MGSNSPNEVGPLSEQPFDPDDPPRIGRYEVLARLGGGGMATVYLGRGPSGRQVAVKLIRPDLAADEGFRQRFEREAAWVRRVRQAYIAPVLDFGDHQGRPFLVTEYIEGPTLEQAVRERGPMPTYEVEQLGEQVASALAAIHAVRLVHRDLKPSNVILGRTGPRVIDFGIARALDDSGGLTSQNVRLGTPSYMAPEQFDEDAEVGQPADVFAWGGLVLYASTGRPPFGTATNRREVAVLANLIATRGPPRLNELQEPLRTLVRAAMAKDPARRPTARDLVRRLSGGDQPTPTEAAPTTDGPASTAPGPPATAPVLAPALTAPGPPSPQGPPPTARIRSDDDWQPTSAPPGRLQEVLSTWKSPLVWAGLAFGVLFFGWLLWVNMVPAVQLLAKVTAGGVVVLALVGVLAWLLPDDRRAGLLWLLAGLVLLLGLILWVTIDQLTDRIWVGLHNDQVAVLEGAGPDGLLGVENIHKIEQSPTAAHRRQLPALLAAAVDDGLGVGDHDEGARIARCLRWVFTATSGTPAPDAEACQTSVLAATPPLPVPRFHTEDATRYPPAAATTDDQVLLAWTSYNGTLQVSSSDDGSRFTPPVPLDGFESDWEPALATDGSRFFLAWRDRSGQLALASSTNGEDFSDPVVLNATTKVAPALAYGNGMLLVAWVDDHRKLHLWPAADAASLQFVEEERADLDETSSASPNLHYADETWYLTWAGGGRRVNILTYDGDFEGAPVKYTLNDFPGAPFTQHRPAVAVLDVWLLAWTDPDGRVRLFASKSRQPGYVNELTLDIRSAAGVNLIPFREQVLLTWGGDNQQPGGHVVLLP